jgi:hypothetical protein
MGHVYLEIMFDVGKKILQREKLIFDSILRVFLGSFVLNCQLINVLISQECVDMLMWG